MWSNLGSYLYFACGIYFRYRHISRSFIPNSSRLRSKTNIKGGTILFFPDKNENILKIRTVPLPLDGKLLRKRTPGNEASSEISQ